MIIIVFYVYGSEHRKNVTIYIQQDATLHSLLYLETALHISGGTTTHRQERKQLYLQHLVFVTPLLLPAAIVEVMERSYTVYYTWKLLYIFRVVPPPIVRSANNCIYSMERSWNAVTPFIISGNAPVDGWRYHPKHVDQFPYIISCVTLHLVGYTLEYGGL